MISPRLLELRWKSLAAHLQQKWQTALNVYKWVPRWQQTGELRAAVYVLSVMWNVNVWFLLKTVCLLHDRFTLHTVNSIEKLLKPFHSRSGAVWWSTLQMLVEVSYYIDISTKKTLSLCLATYWLESFDLLQALRMWTLDHCLLSSWQWAEIYIFSVTASVTPNSPGFSSGWHFSCHAIWIGLSRQAHSSLSI